MFRDETEAALARAEAAERELAELQRHGEADDAQIEELKRTIAEQRAEIARLSKEAGVEAKQKEKKRERAQEAPRFAQRGFLRKHAAALIWFGMIAASGLATVAFVFGSRACGEHQVETKPGRLYHAELVRTAEDQPRLLVVSEPGEEVNDEFVSLRWRLDLVDPATGRRLVRKVFEQPARPEVEAADRGHLWCATQVSNVQRLELREVATLAVTTSHEALVQRIPALGAGLHGSIAVDGWSGAAIVSTKSGELLLIDPKTLAARPLRYSAEVVAVEARAGGGRVLLASLRAAKFPGAGELQYRAGNNFVFLPSYDPGSKEHQLLKRFPRLKTVGQSQHGTESGGYLEDDEHCSFKADDGGHRQVLTVAGRALAGSSFLSPELVLASGAEYQALTLPEKGGVIVAHTDSMDLHAGRRLLSRLSLDGKTHWTLTEPSSLVKLGFLHGDLVVIALDSRPGLVLGIAWRDGTVRWRYGP